MHDRNPTGFRSTGRMSEQNIAREALGCSSWVWGMSAMESLHEFLRWGPYGLYATFAMMLFAIPLGWLYAYLAFVGYRRDITEPNSQRQKAALGGVIIIALTIFLWRHLLVSDIHEYPLGDMLHWVQTALPRFIGILLSPVTAYAEPSHNLLVRLIASVALIVLVPAVFIITLWALLVGTVAVFAGAAASMVASFAFVAASLAAAVSCVPGFFLGVPILLYFLFVRLPLQVTYRRAIREGRWPTTAELVLALNKGLLDKTDWQSKIMAHKSRKFEGGLNEKIEKLSRTK